METGGGNSACSERSGARFHVFDQDLLFKDGILALNIKLPFILSISTEAESMSVPVAGGYDFKSPNLATDWCIAHSSIDQSRKSIPKKRTGRAVVKGISFD